MKHWITRFSLAIVVVGVFVLAGSCDPFDPLAAAGYGDLKIYWVTRDTLSSASLEGSDIKTVYTDADSSAEYRGIALDKANEYIYWSATGPTTNKIYRSSLDGSENTTIQNGIQAQSLALDVAGDRLYYSTNTEIWRCSLDGSNAEILWNGGGSIWDIDLNLSDNRIYWSDAGTIYRSTIADPLNPSSVVVTGNMVEAIALDVKGSKLYWFDAITENIVQSDLDGIGQDTLYTSVDATSLAVDPYAGTLYWGEENAMTAVRVFTATIAGSTPSTIIDYSGGGHAWDIVLDLWP